MERESQIIARVVWGWVLVHVVVINVQIFCLSGTGCMNGGCYVHAPIENTIFEQRPLSESVDSLCRIGMDEIIEYVEVRTY